MGKNWPKVLGAGVIVAIPLGIALRQDMTQEPAPPAARAPIVPAAAPADESVAPAAMDRIFFDDVLGAAKRRPSLVGPLFRVKWWLKREELKRDAPELYSWHQPDVTLRTHFDREKGLDAIRIEFPDDGTALRALQAAWGPGVSWASPATGLAATYGIDDVAPGRAFLVLAPIRP